MVADIQGLSVRKGDYAMSARTDIVGIGTTGSSNWGSEGILRGRVTPDVTIRLTAQSRCDWSAIMF
jgi:hypothetical protein